MINQSPLNVRIRGINMKLCNHFHIFALGATLFFSIGAAHAAPITRSISNPLKLHWPHELVHFDVPATGVSDEMSVQIGEETRPAQVEKLEGGKARIWFIASLKGGNDAPKEQAVTLVAGKNASPLKISRGENWITIDNGVSQFRVPDFASRADFKARPLKEMPTVLGGIKGQNETGAFYGKSWFESENIVTSARTEILASGPVFVTVRVTYNFAPPQGAKPGTDYSYQATLRFVSGDAWIDVSEKYNLPTDAHYWLELKDGLEPDTVMFVPWFSYEAFGGNVDMQFTKLEPRAKQRGPFVAMRPRWNQMPGGGQDFFVTRGGPSPYRAKDGPLVTPPNYSATAPAVGIIATNPMKWLDPYAQTINAYAENGTTARLKFPLKSGARSYAIVVGPRGQLDDTGKINSLVRRHTDWTLDDQINKYVLEWPRNPDKAGPHIFITRADLKRLQDDFKSGKDTPEMRVLKEFVAKKDSLKGADKDLLNLITGEPAKKPNLPSAELWLQRRYQDDFLNPTGQTRKVSMALADLFSGGQPIGGASQAALGYIFSDLNQWPGYENGWGPGNPNFHTDKYMVAIMAGAAMLDHPDSSKWLAYGKKNFDEDQKKVLLAPSGVGYECPGYAGYSLGLQMEIAEVFKNTGYGNPVVENPLYKKTGIWHRHLLTPLDVRLGLRHEAPIGDTHRWNSGAQESFGRLAKFYKEADPAFAGEMMGTYKLLRDQGLRGSLRSDLIGVDWSVAPTPLEKMDWGSGEFYGFGSIMRSNFNTPRETFVSFKAGPAQGHYHNDELSYHFYGQNTPLSLDYNCSYHPRGDHAALHNSMTFGITKPFTHAGDAKAVEAMEQIGGTARVGAWKSSAVADLVVAERTSESLTLSPIYPDDAKFQYPYPARKAPVPITHRRFLALVKHAPGSKLADYLVVRDETRSADRQQLNIHLLARDAKRDGQIIRATGQWNTDALVYLANPKVEKVDVGRWYYFDEYMSGPGQYGDGKSEAHRVWAQKIRDSDGEALIPPVGWKDKWMVGEYQKWLKIETAPGTPMTWVLYPKKQGEAEPQFETLEDGRGVRVQLGDETDEVFLSTQWPAGAKTPGQAWITQNGKMTSLLAGNTLPPLGEIKNDAGLSSRIVDDAAPIK